MGQTASVVTIGLKKISIAPIASDGGPGTVFVDFGNVSTDSFNFAEEEPTTKTVSIEESSSPLKEFKTKGKLVVNCNIADADTDMFALLRGGAVTTASGVKTYKEGDAVANAERTVKIEPAEGLTFVMNRAALSGQLTGGLGKNQELFLAVSITALKPNKSGVETITVIETIAA